MSLFNSNKTLHAKRKYIFFVMFMGFLSLFTLSGDDNVNKNWFKPESESTMELIIRIKIIDKGKGYQLHRIGIGMMNRESSCCFASQIYVRERESGI